MVSTDGHRIEYIGESMEGWRGCAHTSDRFTISIVTNIFYNIIIIHLYSAYSSLF